MLLIRGYGCVLRDGQEFHLGAVPGVELWAPAQLWAVSSCDSVGSGPLHLTPGPTLRVYSLRNSASLVSEYVLVLSSLGSPLSIQFS